MKTTINVTVSVNTPIGASPEEALTKLRDMGITSPLKSVEPGESNNVVEIEIGTVGELLLIHECYEEEGLFFYSIISNGKTHFLDGVGSTNNILYGMCEFYRVFIAAMIILNKNTEEFKL